MCLPFIPPPVPAPSVFISSVDLRDDCSLSANRSSHLLIRARLYLSSREMNSVKFLLKFSRYVSYLPNPKGRKSEGRSIDRSPCDLCNWTSKWFSGHWLLSTGRLICSARMSVGWS